MFDEKLNTENFTVTHEKDCNQTGDLCLCFKRELRRLFKILDEYQDEILELQRKMSKWEADKYEKKKIETSQKKESKDVLL